MLKYAATIIVSIFSIGWTTSAFGATGTPVVVDDAVKNKSFFQIIVPMNQSVSLQGHVFKCTNDPADWQNVNLPQTEVTRSGNGLLSPGVTVMSNQWKEQIYSFNPNYAGNNDYSAPLLGVIACDTLWIAPTESEMREAMAIGKAAEINTMLDAQYQNLPFTKIRNILGVGVRFVE